jgi:predicted GH43/DUF377 family glycosyl hydrolase
MNNFFELLTGRLLILIILCVAVVVSVIYFSLHLINLYNLKKAKRKAKEIELNRYKSNPIIKPKAYSKWETVGTFNPAAVVDDEGFVHLLYRAIGDDGVSRVGHAKSINGLDFDDKSPYPVYVYNPTQTETPKYYDTNIYTSGGSWGGCEDPRAVVIDGRIYMTYTAFEGWQSVRIALTSISMDDFKKERWNWKKPQYISSSDQVNKNWVLFPEKINGKYAIINSIVPKVMIEYVDSLDNFSGNLKSSRPEGSQPGRNNLWDNSIRGSGPPPIKTKLGWLLLYHAMDKNDWGKYKVGAMVLDSKDPAKVLYRSSEPIFQPDAPYENDGKPGVVYASGALVIGDDLFVYYGGGDKNVCTAKTPLKPLLAWLKKYGKV